MIALVKRSNRKCIHKYRHPPPPQLHTRRRSHARARFIKVTSTGTSKHSAMMLSGICAACGVCLLCSHDRRRVRKCESNSMHVYTRTHPLYVVGTYLYIYVYVVFFIMPFTPFPCFVRAFIRAKQLTVCRVCYISFTRPLFARIHMPLRFKCFTPFIRFFVRCCSACGIKYMLVHTS